MTWLGSSWKGQNQAARIQSCNSAIPNTWIRQRGTASYVKSQSEKKFNKMKKKLQKQNGNNFGVSNFRNCYLKNGRLK